MNTFALAFADGVRVVTAASPEVLHPELPVVVAGLRCVDGDLVVGVPGWDVVFLGAGEEKAVYCLRDPLDRVVAVEVIDERGYLNGRLLDGWYAAPVRCAGVRAGATGDPGDALVGFGLRYTGLVKVREYVHGYEWARFRLDARRRSVLDAVATAWLRLWLGAAMDRYRARYGDVHERNVLFELRPPGSRGVPLVVRDARGRLRRVRVGLRPVDLR